jgi:hypothetical protein
MSAHFIEASVRPGRFMNARGEGRLVAYCWAAMLSHLIDVWRTRQTARIKRCLDKGLCSID